MSAVTVVHSSLIQRKNTIGLSLRRTARGYAGVNTMAERKNSAKVDNSNLSVGTASLSSTLVPLILLVATRQITDELKS